MKRPLLVGMLIFMLSGYCLAQLAYPVVGTYKKKSAQGMAIHQDRAYLFSDGGRCRMSIRCTKSYTSCGFEEGVLKYNNLSYLTTNEPEDMDFYKGNALLYCGQEGGIYKLKLK